MTYPTFTSPAGERSVVVPEEAYRKLVEASETLEDIEALEALRAKLANGEEEFIPSDIVDRLLTGENRVRVWRERRGLTSAQLAELAGVDPSYISAIESGRREGTAETLASLATVLNVAPSDLMLRPANARVIAILEEREAWLSVAELAAAVGASERHVRAVCEWMVTEGKAQRQDGDRARYRGL